MIGIAVGWPEIGEIGGPVHLSVGPGKGYIGAWAGIPFAGAVPGLV